MWHLKSRSDNPEGTDGSRGCAASGLGVAGTALETDVNFFFFLKILYGKLQTYVEADSIIYYQSSSVNYLLKADFVAFLPNCPKQIPERCPFAGEAKQTSHQTNPCCPVRAPESQGPASLRPRSLSWGCRLSPLPGDAQSLIFTVRASFFIF